MAFLNKCQTERVYTNWKFSYQTLIEMSKFNYGKGQLSRIWFDWFSTGDLLACRLDWSRLFLVALFIMNQVWVTRNRLIDWLGYFGWSHCVTYARPSNWRQSICVVKYHLSSLQHSLLGKYHNREDFVCLKQSLTTTDWRNGSSYLIDSDVSHNYASSLQQWGLLRLPIY